MGIFQKWCKTRFTRNKNRDKRDCCPMIFDRNEIMFYPHRIEDIRNLSHLFVSRLFPTYFSELFLELKLIDKPRRTFLQMSFHIGPYRTGPRSWSWQSSSDRSLSLSRVGCLLRSVWSKIPFAFRGCKKNKRHLTN